MEGDNLTKFGFAMAGLISILVFVPPLVYSYAKDLVQTAKTLDENLKRRTKHYFFATDQIAYTWGIHAAYGILIGFWIVMYDTRCVPWIIGTYIVLAAISFGISLIVLCGERRHEWGCIQSFTWVLLVFLWTVGMNGVALLRLMRCVNIEAMVLLLCWTFIHGLGYFVMWWGASLVYRPLEAYTKDL